MPSYKIGNTIANPTTNGALSLLNQIKANTTKTIVGIVLPIAFKGLKKFKEKYATRWEDRYIAYKKGSSVIITVIQLMLVLTKEKDDFCK